MAKKIFTDESLATFVDEIKSYTDETVSGKANSSHTHSIDDVTNLQAALDTLTENKSDKTHTHSNVTETVSGMMSPTDKVKLDNIEEKATYSIPIVQMTSTDGVAYTATIDGVEELRAGMVFMFVPDKTSTSKVITLNVNGLGDFTIRRKLSMGTASGAQGILTTQLYAGRGTLLMYDNSVGSNKFWFALDFTKPCASDLYGSVPVQSGGTHINDETTEEDLEAARENLSVYSKADQEMTLIYDSGEISEPINAFANIDISGYKKLIVTVKCVNDGTNNPSKHGGVMFTATNGTTYQFNIWSTLFTNAAYTSGAMATFEINNGWLICSNAIRILKSSNFLGTEGGVADNLNNTGGGIMKCTNALSTMMISSTDQDSNYYFLAGSRVMVWGCKA